MSNHENTTNVTTEGNNVDAANTATTGATGAVEATAATDTAASTETAPTATTTARRNPRKQVKAETAAAKHAAATASTTAATADSEPDTATADTDQADKPDTAATDTGAGAALPATVNFSTADQAAPATPAIVPVTAVKGFNLADVYGYDLRRWPSLNEAINSTPYYVGVSVIDQMVVAADDISTDAVTFVDKVPPLAVDATGKVTTQAYCMVHWADTLLAVRALGFTGAMSMIEATAASYLMPNAFALTTTEWQSTVGQRVWGARGESKCNAFSPAGSAAKMATQQKGVTYGNTTRMRIELARARINGGISAAEMAQRAFAGAGRAMPLTLLTGLGADNLYLPAKSTPARFKWHPHGLTATGDLVDYESSTAVERASLVKYVAHVAATQA